jgi:hypothetical protein
MARVLRYLPALAVVCACSHDWDSLDPRLGSGGVPGTGGTGGSAGAGNSGGTAGAVTGGTTGGGTGGSVGGGGASGSAGSGGGTGGTPTGGGTGGTGGMDAGPGTVTYPAAIAECIAITNPDPAACEATAGAGLMTIDTQTSIIGTSGNYATAGYLRFDLDGAISGKTISAVTLRMRVGNQNASDSPMSGEINLVTCFTLADLSSVAPAKQGVVISPNQGAVAEDEVVDFPLPVSTVTASQPVCLGIYALNFDGVDYVNTKGANPPQLIIDYQ